MRWFVFAAGFGVGCLRGVGCRCRCPVAAG
jgi:hypothetical protein